MAHQASSEFTHNHHGQIEQAAVEVPKVVEIEPAKVVAAPVSTIAEEDPCFHDEKQ